MSGKSKTILLVDDDNDIRDILKETLEGEGYHVFAASNGKEALEALDDMPSPCVILLDLMMPVMDGWKFLENKKKDSRIMSVPVYAFSASEKEVSSPDLAGIIRKPSELDEILKAVHCCC